MEGTEPIPRRGSPPRPSTHAKPQGLHGRCAAVRGRAVRFVRRIGTAVGLQSMTRALPVMAAPPQRRGATAGPAVASEFASGNARVFLVVW